MPSILDVNLSLQEGCNSLMTRYSEVGTRRDVTHEVLQIYGLQLDEGT